VQIALLHCLVVVHGQLDDLAGAAQRIGDAVQRIADDAKDTLDASMLKRGDQIISCGVHAAPPEG
jgi:hypothetical protein